MIQSRVFAEGEEVNEGPSFRARVVRRYMSHVLSFPQMLSNAPSKAGLNTQYYTPLRQCSAFCMDESSSIPIPLTFTRIEKSMHFLLLTRIKYYHILQKTNL